MTTGTTITTPLPAGATAQAVVENLHNHELYIKTTCPQLISQKHVSGTPGPGQPCVYEITDKRPVGQTTFTMTLTNVADGVDAVIDGRAPTGSLVIRSQWRARAQTQTLEEVVEIESNIVTKKLIKGNVEKAHPGFHHAFFAEAVKA